MKHSFLIVGLVILALVLGSSAYVEAASPDQDKGLVYQNIISVTGPWEPQVPTAFTLFRRIGKGYEVRPKAVGNQWVHISMPNMYDLENKVMSLSRVEFCGQSANGAVAKAARMVIWNYGSSVGAKNISWVNNTSPQCFYIDFIPALFYRDVTLSVLLSYTDINYTFTLLRAEIVTRVEY